MALRTRSEIVTFSKPFSLAGLDDVQPPGRYTVETDEELLPTVSHSAYRRLATWFRLPALAADGGSTGGRSQVAAIDPSELDAALARDGALKA